MNRTVPRILLACSTLLAVACLCSIALACLGVGAWSFQPSQALLPTPSIDLPTPFPRPDGEDLDAQIAEEMNLIESQVIAIRGMQPNTAVERSLFTPDQLASRLRDDFEEDYPPGELRQDQIVLSALGLIERDFELGEFYIDLLSEQIAGFYDNEAKTMTVITGAGFDGPARLTYAHEYVHALQDMVYDIKFGLGYSDEACQTQTERCAALLALIEGDATLVQERWLQTYASGDDLDEILAFYTSLQTPVLDQAPGFLREDLLFPYQWGRGFVSHLVQQGGWDAVDHAYTNPPLSTEQILHPERYPDDAPLTVTLPDVLPVLGSDWEFIDGGVLGEWSTYLMLAFGQDANARLSQARASEAAAGWGGDAFAVLFNPLEERFALVYDSLWDSESEANQFAESLRAYLTGRIAPLERVDDQLWSTGQSVLAVNVFHSGTRVIWTMAPETAQSSVMLDLLLPAAP